MLTVTDEFTRCSSPVKLGSRIIPDTGSMSKVVFLSSSISPRPYAHLPRCCVGSWFSSSAARRGHKRGIERKKSTGQPKKDSDPTRSRGGETAMRGIDLSMLCRRGPPCLPTKPTAVHVLYAGSWRWGEEFRGCRGPAASCFG